jgi:hypothetical protein
MARVSRLAAAKHRSDHSDRSAKQASELYQSINTLRSTLSEGDEEEERQTYGELLRKGRHLPFAPKVWFHYLSLASHTLLGKKGLVLCNGAVYSVPSTACDPRCYE